MHYLNNKLYPTITNNCILGFFDNYRFLSNFHLMQNPITLDGVEYYSSEAAYMACKTDDLSIKIKLSKMTPSESKKFGQTFKLKEDWDNIRIEEMYKVCLQKFDNNEDIKIKLLNTTNKRVSFLTI